MSGKDSQVSPDELAQAMTGGIVFRKAPQASSAKKGVKTKAQKKTYITGAHGSGAAKKKAEIRTKRANRHKGK